MIPVEFGQTTVVLAVILGWMWLLNRLLDHLERGPVNVSVED